MPVSPIWRILCAVLLMIAGLSPLMATSPVQDVRPVPSAEASDNSVIASTTDDPLAIDAGPGISEFAIGVVGGINYNSFSANLQDALPASNLAILEGGSGFSGMIGLSIDLLPYNNSGAQFRFAYEVKSYDSQVQWTSECFGSESMITPLKAKTQHEFSQGFFAMSALLRFAVLGDISIMAGPTIQMSVGNASVNIEQDPAEAHSCADVPLALNDPLNRRSFETTPDQDFRWGLDLALAYRPQLSDDWILSAELGAQYFVTYLHRNADELTDYSRPLSSGLAQAQISDQILHSIQARLGLLYTL